MPYVIAGAVALAYLYPIVRLSYAVPDFGILLNGADQISKGAVPGRDFVEMYAPGSFVWLAMFFRFFGATLGTAAAVLDATGVGIALLAFYLSRRLGATGLFAMLFVLTMSVPVLPINSPHYDSNLFALAAFAIFLRAWDQLLAGEEPDVWLLVATATLCGITTWMIQPKGVYLMLSMIAALAWQLRGRARRAMVIMGVTYGAWLLLPLGVFALLRALPDLLFANYVWPLKQYGGVNAVQYGFPIWSNFLSDWYRHAHLPASRGEDIVTKVPFLIVVSLPVLLPLAATLAGKRWRGTSLLPYWLAAYSLWLSELHRLDIGHLRNGVVLMAILFFSICEAARSVALRRSGLVLSMFVAITACTNLMASMAPGPVIRTRRGLMHGEDDAALVQFLEDHTQAGDEVFIYPYQPIYYFAENLKNPTRYSYMQYHFNTEDQFREAAQDLERKNVRYVVFDAALSGERFREMFPAYRQPDKSQLIMEPYLDQHYRLVQDLGRFHVLQRVR